MFEIARQFGGWIDGENLDEVRFNDDDFERFVNFMVAAEREACAKVVEADPSYDWHRFACEAAAAIRARSNP